MPGVRLQQLDLHDPRWRGAVETTSTWSPFLHREWAQLLVASYGGSAFALADVDSSGVRGGVPVVELGGRRRRRWVALPFTDACEPLKGDGWDDERFAGGLRRAVEESGVGRFVLRSSLAGLDGETVGYAHTLLLDRDSEAIFQRFKKTRVQQAIVQGQQAGLTVAVVRDEHEFFNSFYRLHLASRRRLGVPVQPRRFFRLLWDHMIHPGRGFALTVSADTRPVASAVFLTGGRTVVYKYSASDPAAWKLRPNNLLLWEAIRWACGQGFETFDFGRTDLENHGLRQFKRGWGTHESELVYSSIGKPSGGLNLHRLSEATRPVVQHSPRFVCRIMGEALYRFTE